MTEQAYGEHVRAARIAQCWSQREVCASLGVSPQYYNDIEHGRRTPGDGVAERIEVLLGVVYRTPREAKIEAKLLAALDAAATREAALRRTTTDDALVDALAEAVFCEFSDRSGLDLGLLVDFVQDDIQDCLARAFRAELVNAQERADQVEGGR